MGRERGSGAQSNCLLHSKLLENPVPIDQEERKGEGGGGRERGEGEGEGEGEGDGGYGVRKIRGRKAEC
jgi:hypothetical protein